MSEATTQVSQTQFDVSQAIDDGGFTTTSKNGVPVRRIGHRSRWL
jgi:hypothetical protein